MRHVFIRLHAFIFSWRHMGYEEFLALFLALFVFVMPSAAATRLQERGLFMQSAVPGVTTSYTLSWHYTTPAAVGSVDMQFCIDPIPYMPCVTPPGLDASNAILSSQSGETGFTILSKTTNHIIITRPPSMIMSGDASSYTFDNIVNPTDTSEAFAIRLRTHSTTDATGPQIDFGSVRGQVTDSVELQTQVPPILVFCLAEQVNDNCEGTNDIYYHDMGQLSPQSTLTAHSQMGVGTNATAGFVITANGDPPTAGTNVIDGSPVAMPSMPGTNQFGINLVANSDPVVGGDPEGTWANALPTADYSTPNRYKFVSGDVVASSPNVSLMKKFTVSYILNASPNLRAGVYSTTITYIASGRF